MSTKSPIEEATDKITENIRKLVSLKITLPLGNPNLWLLHTNQFLWLDLPEEFSLANMDAIGNALNSDSSRYSNYQKNRWYIEGVTVTNNGSDAKIELDLNPFGSPITSYKDNYYSYLDAYDSAVSNNSNNNTSNSNKVSSVSSDNSSVKGGEGKVIDDKVKEIIGDETDNLKKAKLIHKWLVKNRHYRGYANSRTKTPLQAYNRRNNPGINCADTSRLTASMLRSAGVKCFVVHSTFHYYTVFKYKGKLYCTDATSDKAKFNEYWKSSGGWHGKRVKFTGKNCYYAKCGDNPCS